MKKLMLYISVIFVLAASSFALNECKGTIMANESPCLIFLTYYGNCPSVNVSFYNGSTLLSYQNMSNYSTNLCNATFPYTALGTYTLAYSTNDTGSITVIEDSTVDIGNITVMTSETSAKVYLFWIGLVITLAILVFAFFRQDSTAGSIGSFLGIILGVAFIVGDFVNFNNYITIGIGVTIIGICGYILIMLNLETIENLF